MTLDGTKMRLCVIGAGPSGCSFMTQFAIMAANGKTIPEIVCYEQQSEWGGQWCGSGASCFVKPHPSSMYRGMYTNIPKESMELPDYSFDQHFKTHVSRFITQSGSSEDIG